MALNSPLVPDDIGALPEKIREALATPELNRLFAKYKYYEQIRELGILRSAIDVIEQYSQENGLVVYHCTRELFPGKLMVEGLRVLDHQKHVDEFLQYTKEEGLLANHERQEIEPTLRTWRDGTAQTRARDGTLHFLHSRHEVGEWGTEKFFRHYGGEALYWPFGPWGPGPGHWFLGVLEKIGEPVVVETKIDPSDLISGSKFGAGTVISCFARSVNSRFEPHHPFCLTRKSVPSSRIISVTPIAAFVERSHLKLDWKWRPHDWPASAP